jgi:hypothetical protein
MIDTSDMAISCCLGSGRVFGSINLSALTLPSRERGRPDTDRLWLQSQ